MVDEQAWSDIGARVRYARQSLGMSQVVLGSIVGLDRTMIAKVEKGSRRLDAFELARFGSALRVSLDYLVNPLPEVISHRSALLTEESDTDVGRRTDRLDIALVEWLHNVRQLIDHGLLRPKPIERPGFVVESRADARSLAIWLRSHLGVGIGPIQSLLEFCERAGQWVLVTDLPGDGASMVDGELAVAVVSAQGTPGRRRATAGHELGHLIIGDPYSSDLGVNSSREEREAVIDAFAAELLLPVRALTDAATDASDTLSRGMLVEVAARYRTSWSLALRQAGEAGLIDAAMRRTWSQTTPTRAEFMEAVGWAPQPDLEAVRVPPSYAHAVMEALRRSLITRRRAVDLMYGQITESDLPSCDEVEIEP